MGGRRLLLSEMWVSVPRDSSSGEVGPRRLTYCRPPRRLGTQATLTGSEIRR